MARCGDDGTLDEAPSIAAINRLPEAEKRAIYLRMVPTSLLDRFALPADFIDPQGRPLAEVRCQAGSTDVVVCSASPGGGGPTPCSTPT